ncbi:hypothetical protein [Neolewinella agarilytica]|uniref:hypothetical protein n=1 Tax=Neolewinella agarilytica TaxID=478744 RepID=UPI0023523A6A|nr:hypothetical protein [Neolewinella agarilytica]
MRIFNQLRKFQIEKQKIKNYFIYALGEIVLIVVGILIAVQINNCNQSVSEEKQRMEALEILQQAFQTNSLEIENTLSNFERLSRRTNLRISHSGPEAEAISDSLIKIIRQIDIVKLNLVNEGEVSTFNLSLLSEELRNLLLHYSTVHKAYKQQEDNVTNLSMKLRENHQQYVSLLTQRTYDEGFSIMDRNIFPSDYAGWLSDRDNQNLSVEIKWKAEVSVEKLKSLQEINEVVLQTIWNKLYNKKGSRESAVALPRS